MTEDAGYAARLQRLELARWKTLLDVQTPYRWNVRRACPGRVLEVGCGIGRNLSHLQGRGVGVDHNATSVATARARGLEAYTVADFVDSPRATQGAFDALLVAHVLEHLDEPAGDALLKSYLPFVRPGGRVVLITPQERGWRSDATHVRWVGPLEIAAACQRAGLRIVEQRSFPFPRPAGRVFPYNEFVCVARTAGGT